MAKIVFFLPFFMLGGTSLQSGGLYLFAILLPWLLGRHSFAQDRKATPNFLYIGLGLILIFTIFPLANFIAFISAKSELTNFLSLNPIALHKLFDSHFSSAILVTGIFLILLEAFLRTKTQDQSSTHFEPNDLFISFTKGTLAASCMLGCYLLFQHMTGFDYKAANYKLESAKQIIGNSTYRTLGFYSHPLSLAGGSLALLSFYWILFCETFAKKASPAKKVDPNPFLRPKLRAYYLAIACLHLVFIIFSGGRFALLIATGFFLLYPFLVPLGKKLRLIRLGFTALALTATLSLSFQSGILNRFQELKVLWRHDQLDRFKFWQVHWQMVKDKPWFGHGHIWLKHYKRDLYYNQLGFENLANKYNAHNLYLEILANIGILGLAGVLGGSLLIAAGFKSSSSPSQHKVLFFALLVALIANLVNGITQNTLFDSNIVYVYLFLAWVLIWNLLFTSSKKLY